MTNGTQHMCVAPASNRYLKSLTSRDELLIVACMNNCVRAVTVRGYLCYKTH